MRSEQEIIARLNAIGGVARERMRACDGITNAARGGAEIDYMTADERQEQHDLKMSLPTFGELREAASERIKAKIAARKAKREKV